MLNRRLRRLGAVLAAALVFAACGQGAVSPATSAGSAPAATAAPAESQAAGPSGTTEPPAPSDKRLVFASRETIDSAFAVETDDAFALHFLGVAETLTRNNFEGLLEPALATEWERTGDLLGVAMLQKASRSTMGHHSMRKPSHSSYPSARRRGSCAVLQSEHLRLGRGVGLECRSRDDGHTQRHGAVLPRQPEHHHPREKAYGGDQIDPIEAGTGPFVMTAMNLPQEVNLDRNEDYWGGPVALAGADVQFIPEGGTRATQVQTGEADLADSIPIPVVPTLEADPNLTIVRGPLQRTNTLYMNNQKEPFTDVRVRQAIQSAIDVDALANAVLEGAVTPAIGPFSPSAAWAPAGAQAVARDVDKAKALLADAGIEPGSLTVGLWAYPSRPELPDVAVAIQAMLLEAGINVEVRVADYAALEPDVLAGNFDMMLVSRSYLVDINDPISYLRSDYSCEGTYNLSHYCDEALDAQLEEALTNEDATARYQTYSEIATKLQADAVDVFLYHPEEISAIRKTVQNYRIHPMQHFVLTPELAISD